MNPITEQQSNFDRLYNQAMIMLQYHESYTPAEWKVLCEMLLKDVFEGSSNLPANN